MKPKCWQPNDHSVAEPANIQSDERLIIINEPDTKRPVLTELERDVRKEM